MDAITHSELPEDESLPTPMLSARAKRLAAASVVVVVAGFTVLSSAHHAAQVISLRFLLRTTEQIPEFGVFAFLLLVLVTSLSGMLGLLIWRISRPSHEHRVLGFRGGIKEVVLGSGMLFGFLVLLSWIPYLAIWPLALEMHLSGSGDFLVLLAEIWILFCAPFLVGLVSSRRTGRAGPSFAAAFLTILVIATLYVPLIHAASPPFLSSQLEKMKRQAEEEFGSARGGVVVVTPVPSLHYPVGVPSVFMLLSLILGLASGHGMLRHGKLSSILSAKHRLLLAVLVSVLAFFLLWAFWFWLSAFTAFPTGAICNLTVGSVAETGLPMQMSYQFRDGDIDVEQIRDVVRSMRWVLVTLDAAMRGNVDEARVEEIRKSTKHVEIVFSKPVWVWSRGSGVVDSRRKADRILITLSEGGPGSGVAAGLVLIRPVAVSGSPCAWSAYRAETNMFFSSVVRRAQIVIALLEERSKVGPPGPAG